MSKASLSSNLESSSFCRGLFESTGLEWWEKSWGGYFTSFGDFLGFSWEVMGEFMPSRGIRQY